MASGDTAAAETVATLANYAYVPQMNFPELDAWASRSGLSREELALIQPGYYMTFSGELLWMSIIAWVMGVIAIAINVVQLRKQQFGIVLPVIGFAAGVLLLLSSVSVLADAWMAFKVGTHPDNPNFIQEPAMNAFGPLLLGGLIGFGLSLLAGSLSFYRIHKFFERREMRDTLAE